MLQSYYNPTVFEPTMTSKLAEGIIAEKDTNWGEKSNVTWESLNYPLRYETIEADRTDVIASVTNVKYSLEEIKNVREDFGANFNNLRKYPKMTTEDWE